MCNTVSSVIDATASSADLDSDYLIEKDEISVEDDPWHLRDLTPQKDHRPSAL